jgi:hypothetical protein
MKLTKTHKADFIANIATSIPRKDPLVQVHELMQEYFYTTAPVEAQHFYTSQTTKQYLLAESVYIPFVCEEPNRRYYKYTGLGGLYLVPKDFEFENLPQQVQTAVKQLFVEANDQNDARSKLIDDLEAAIAKIKTRDSLAEMLPDYKNYLPEEPTVVPTSTEQNSDLQARIKTLTGVLT